MKTISLRWFTWEYQAPILPPEVTSACPAASAETKSGGAILHSRRWGFQHSLHALMFSCILGVAQTLWLTRCCWRTARELARLQNQSEVRMWGTLIKEAIKPGLNCSFKGNTLSSGFSLFVWIQYIVEFCQSRGIPTMANISLQEDLTPEREAPEGTSLSSVLHWSRCHLGETDINSWKSKTSNKTLVRPDICFAHQLSWASLSMLMWRIPVELTSAPFYGKRKETLQEQVTCQRSQMCWASGHRTEHAR